MNDVERVVARFEANPGVFGALSTGEQIAIALIYDRPELFPELYNTRSAATMRLGTEWWDMVCAYVDANAPVWGNKTEIMTGVRLCRIYRRILAAIRALETVADGCYIAELVFRTGYIEEELCSKLKAVEEQILVLHKEHVVGDCACSFCKHFEGLGLWD